MKNKKEKQNQQRPHATSEHGARPDGEAGTCRPYAAQGGSHVSTREASQAGEESPRPPRGREPNRLRGTRQREGGSPRGGRTPWRESQVAQSRAFTDQERETARRSRKWPRAREMKHDSVVSSKERKIVRRRLEVVTCLSKARGPSVDPIQRPWRWEARHSEEQQAVFFG